MNDVLIIPENIETSLEGIATIDVISNAETPVEEIVITDILGTPETTTLTEIGFPEVVLALENGQTIEIGLFTTLIYFVALLLGALLGLGLWGVHKNA